MVGGFLYFTLPELLPVASIDWTIFIDSASATSPKTTCLPSSQSVLTVVTKNWEPLLWKSKSAATKLGVVEVKAYVCGPALAIDKSPGVVCFLEKFSSGNFSP